MSEKLDISVVVPLYNEEGNVKELHRKIKEACDKLGRSYEIIFVDDGSKDATVENCQALSPLVLVEQRKNYGQTAAFDAGFKTAQGELIITMDGDLQNDPDDIRELLEKMEQGYDVVSGWRWQRKDSLSKHLSSRAANLLRKILIHDNIHDSGCSLKVYRAQALKEIDLFGEMHRFIPAILELDGWKVGEVKVSHHPRVAGVTKYNWKRGVKGIVDMISVWFWRKYSSRPLHLFGGSGVFLFSTGTAILAWMLVEKLFFGAELSEKIWPLVGLFMILVGVQLFVSGLLADIAVKNYYKSQGRMNYAIKSIKRQ